MTKKVKDLAGLIAEVKPRLQDYLEKVGTEFSPNGDKFQCPNRDSHSNNDFTPSCGFFPNDECWHCFVCQENGDIFKAAHYLEDKPKSGNDWILDNVVYLAELLGVEVDYAELTEAEKVVYQTHEALQITAGAAHAGLVQSKDVLEYVKKRGWSDETAKTFQLGYCDYDKLKQALAKRNFNQEVLMRAGLVNSNLLNKRLLFPIKDARGRVIGFASRTLLSHDECREQNIPKYVNSDSNAVYKKSETLYNIDRLQDETTWVVEGYADVVTLHQKGIHNIVGLGGVAFTEDHIQALIKKGVKTLILCLDNDEEGRRSEERILNHITRRHGLNILVKDRDDCKDPDSCLQKHDYLIESGVTTLFEHYLNRHKKSEDKKDRDKALRSVLLERSPIDRERLCKKMAKTLGVRMEVILEEVDHLIKQEGDSTIVNIMDVVKEKQLFESQLLSFETRAWKRGKLLGLATGHPIFTQEMDGIQNQFYIIAGEEGTGKSAFIRSIMTGLLDANPDKVFVLYFSIDDSIPKVISRLLASETRLEINAMENPKWRIEKNENLSPEYREEALKDRQIAFRKLQENASNFVIKDESSIKDTHDMEKAIRTFKELAGDKQLVVFVDSLHRVKQAKKFHESVREQAQQVSDTLKQWCTIYDIPVIATAELRKLNTPDGSTRRPTADDIAEARDFKFDAEILMLLYNDMEANRRTPNAAKLKWEWEKGSSTWYPLVEVFVAKNKSSAFSKRCLYYKFVPPCALMFEATEVEQNQYRAEARDD